MTGGDSMAENSIPFQAAIVTGGAEQRRKRGLLLAQSLVCSGENPPCGQCRDCRKAAAGIHPDVIPVERFMEEKDVGGVIKIEPIRALRADAFVLPNEAAHKVYLIDRAENLNPNAQSVLLKLLEEGPSYAAFLLLTDRPGALLETIRSRCALIHAGGEDDDAVAPDENALRLAETLAAGSELDKMAWLARMECAKPDRAAQERFLAGLEQLLNDAALGSVTGQFSCLQSQSLSQRFSRSELLERAQRVRRAQDMTGFHVGAGHLLGWLGTQL